MDSMSFILFGSTGDLAKRKIYPALYNLFIDKSMPASFSVVGLGRRNWSHEELQRNVEDAVRTFSRNPVDEEVMEKFLQTFRYHPLDVTKPEAYEDLYQYVQKREEELNIKDNRMFYLSVSPKLFDVIITNVKNSGLSDTQGWKRLIIEKPFGHDLESSRELNRKISTVFDEKEIYRIDHYLGKPMVQNLEALEHSNPVLQALWNKKYIANMQITASEIVGVEERAGYYDKVGAIRDMVQNHMLQLIMMTAMRLPNEINAENIRNEKKKVMEALRPLSKEDVAKNVVRGQYGPGIVNDEHAQGYLDEEGIEDDSKNDTYIAARLWIDNDFWKGVPFYIRTGKRMKEKSTRIVMEFKSPYGRRYEDQDLEPNLLIIEISPNKGVTLQLNSKNSLNNGKLEPVHINFSKDQRDLPEAYELLLLDAMRGDQTYFAHWDEVEMSWEWVQPILDVYEQDEAPLYLYEAGSMGPKAADRLIHEDGFQWW
ncbi:glucose-6-phosphate 1-dehydrogenase [Halobacillus andaensis]|uniref:Glucose-6-phosphate 1-dehydrogenase n=1 Tax=Halobacillus andaensis TaxID=1176239 RepID=A0A917AYB0_HALAA|nr:glucose-6-phosphate dehydrogenase [Halobacillus andaensis]MBP2003381.1 glucose-6-phosphate 1-dehydrogenase [Halobacillus andaensis]GGF10216.1 glucose-6-phosphate 1-dehydrogenase [Halobacillus andaensis]